MAIEAAAASAISSAGQITSNFMNMGFQLLQNRSNRKYADRQYERQRADALADWERQNDYNSPEKQMQRLRDAGLNPNLVYGQVNNTAHEVRSSQMQRPETAPLKWERGTNALAQYIQLKGTELQNDNVAKHNALLDKEAILKDIAIQSANMDLTAKEIDLSNLAEMREWKANPRMAKYNKDLADIQRNNANMDYTRAAQQRATELHPGNLTKQAQDLVLQRLSAGKSAAEIQLLKQRIEGEQLQNILRKYEAKLSQHNVNKNDNFLFRVLAEMATNFELEYERLFGKSKK